jgi:hypothetical protein
MHDDETNHQERLESLGLGSGPRVLPDPYDVTRVFYQGSYGDKGDARA